jgi:hypothetical protein
MSQPRERRPRGYFKSELFCVNLFGLVPLFDRYRANLNEFMSMVVVSPIASLTVPVTVPFMMPIVIVPAVVPVVVVG